MTIDIHNYSALYARTETQIRNSDLSPHSKDLIMQFCGASLLQQTCGKVRLIRTMGVLLLAARQLRKDLDQATREDLQALVTHWMTRQPPYSAETISTYKAIIKRFYTWLNNPADFGRRASVPLLVSWITTHVRTKEKKKLQRNELLTPADVERVITVARNPRDKALLAILWETGGRIAEIGNRQIKDAVAASVGYTLEVNGKTGVRSPLIVSSAPLLAQWLNNHPFKTDPEAPLWVRQQCTKPLPVLYQALRKLIHDYFVQAGITKRVYPHLFRHSRATYVLASGLMTEAQAKAYFGWSPNSEQLATYAHLLASDANAAILRENNLVQQREVTDELRAITCYRCHALNAPTNDYCTTCNAVINLQKAYEHQQLHDAKEHLLRSLFKVLVDRGLVDEAARAVHAAGLGKTLKAVALHETGAQNIASNGMTLPTAALPPAASVKQELPPRETKQAV
ncbi:MAG: tyrosine-type recombinase/integrase [Acidobacteria bacterium]|nr:tyrosine-type recombinase/integrase [Acidobacteriota bacterium]MBV9475058.1 tyrosine-type recombinase/integrase [Acidobacteriota bacterium]